MRAVEHYREAEEHLRASEWQRQQAGENDDDAAMADAMHEAAMGQLHATLALAGATALTAYSKGDEAELADWEFAAGGEQG
jgi:hypothetical protein